MSLKPNLYFLKHFDHMAVSSIETSDGVVFLMNYTPTLL